MAWRFMLSGTARQNHAERLMQLHHTRVYNFIITYINITTSVMRFK